MSGPRLKLSDPVAILCFQAELPQPMHDQAQLFQLKCGLGIDQIGTSARLSVSGLVLVNLQMVDQGFGLRTSSLDPAI